MGPTSQFSTNKLQKKNKEREGRQAGSKEGKEGRTKLKET